MIAHLRGELTWAGTDQVIIEVQGVGYRAFVPAGTRAALPGPGHQVLLHTSLQVREDSVTLYGFATAAEFDLFELLLGVTGVGPKVAVGILGAADPHQFRRAILFEDLDVLTRLPGVGKKTAQRLILELREKLGKAETGNRMPAPLGPFAALPADSENGPFGEALAALTGLGYTRGDAQAALDQIKARPGGPGEAETAETLVRLALRWLGGGVGAARGSGPETGHRT